MRNIFGQKVNTLSGDEVQNLAVMMGVPGAAQYSPTAFKSLGELDPIKMIQALSSVAQLENQRAETEQKTIRTRIKGASDRIRGAQNLMGATRYADAQTANAVQRNNRYLQDAERKSQEAQEEREMKKYLAEQAGTRQEKLAGQEMQNKMGIAQIQAQARENAVKIPDMVMMEFVRVAREATKDSPQDFPRALGLLMQQYRDAMIGNTAQQGGMAQKPTKQRKPGAIESYFEGQADLIDQRRAKGTPPLWARMFTYGWDGQ
jgi:hypothetical protein